MSTTFVLSAWAFNNGAAEIVAGISVASRKRHSGHWILAKVLLADVVVVVLFVVRYVGHIYEANPNSLLSKLRP